MNKIENLIKQHCPDGVEFKKLGEVCEVLRGKRLTKKELSANGRYPVFHGGLIPLGNYDKFNRKANQTMVINTGSVGEVVWSSVDFWSSDGTFVIETPNSIDDKFEIYTYIKDYCNDIPYDTEHKRFTIKDEESLKHLLWGIEQRYYTTKVGGEKRVANSVSKI